MKTRHSRGRWLPLHTLQREQMFVEDHGICFFVPLCCEFDANTLDAVLVSVTEVLSSSGFALVELCFIRSWASAFSLNQSLKSRRVGLTQWFLTVKSDHDSFKFGGSFCTAWFSREALFKSASNDSDLKTPARLDLAAEWLMMLSLLCILRGGKLLILSKCAHTTACLLGWPSLRSKS